MALFRSRVSLTGREARLEAAAKGKELPGVAETEEAGIQATLDPFFT